MSCAGLATQTTLGYLRNGGKVTIECLHGSAIQLGNGPSTADELLEGVPFIENEREPISKVLSWYLATRALLENREDPT